MISIYWFTLRVILFVLYIYIYVEVYIDDTGWGGVGVCA
jgi:hypothetical protein